MSPEEKIAKVLKQLKDDAAINPEPHLVKFELNHFVVGAGILSEDEERRILFKLRKDGVIKLRLSEYEDDTPREVTVLSSIGGERFAASRYYWVELLDGFEEKYKSYVGYLKPKRAKENVPSKARGTSEQPVVVSGDYVAGDKVGHDKVGREVGYGNVDHHGSKGLKYWILTAVVGIIVIVVGYFITEGALPRIFSNISIDSSIGQSEEMATTTPNITAILKKNFSFSTTAEEREFRDRYNNSPVYGIGLFKDLDKVGETYYLYMTVERYPVACSFTAVGSEVEKKILLLNADDRVAFAGTFTGGGLWSGSRYVQYPWYIRDCSFI